MLDLFCGLGGWSVPFLRAGWRCTGVDIQPHNYPGKLVLADVLELSPGWIEGFDCVLASPPCDDFARAWLPWCRGDKVPSAEALRLLTWAIALVQSRPLAVCECSVFASRSVPGSVRCGPYALWGDVPLLLPTVRHRKSALSGQSPARRAVIDPHLADVVFRHLTRSN